MQSVNPLGLIYCLAERKDIRTIEDSVLQQLLVTETRRAISTIRHIASHNSAGC